MNEKRNVHELPVLSDYPELPLIPEGKALLLFGSPLKKMEKELVLGYLATISSRNGFWKPVSTHEFRDIMLEKRMPIPPPQQVINAAWDLVEEGLLEIVTLVGEEATDYLVPSRSLAGMLQQCSLRTF